MAWLACDIRGTFIFEKKPKRDISSDEKLSIWIPDEAPYWLSPIQLSKEAVLKLLDRELTWDDEPIEIK